MFAEDDIGAEDCGFSGEWSRMSLLLRTTTGRPIRSLRRAALTLACLGLTSGGLPVSGANAANRSSDPWKRLAERAIVLRRGQVVADVKVDANTATDLRGILK